MTAPLTDGGLPVVVALGPVDPALVSGVLDGHCRFVTAPGSASNSRSMLSSPARLRATYGA